MPTTTLARAMAVVGLAKVRGIAAAAVVPLLLWQAGCAAELGPSRAETVFTGPALGTWYEIKVILDSELSPADALDLEAAVLGEIEFVNERMSTYLDDSELSRFNDSESTEAFPISEATAGVVRAALGMSEASGGAFDVTVGPLVELWGFGAAERRTVPPDKAEIEQVRAEVGWERLALEDGGLRKDVAGLRADLSAIAKGYAVDRVSQYLRDADHVDHMVEIGGEIRVAGRNVRGEPWRLGIERPDPAVGGMHTVLSLMDVAMATSGNYRNFFEWDGKTYAHTIDPRTGWPVEHELASATVLAPTCMQADGYATTLMVLGLEEALTFADREGVAALLLTLGSDGQPVEHASATWAETLATAGGASASE